MKRPFEITLLLTLVCCVGALAAIALANLTMMTILGPRDDSSQVEMALFASPFAVWMACSAVLAWLLVRRNPVARTAAAVYLAALAVELATLAAGRYYSLALLPTASNNLQGLRAHYDSSSHGPMLETTFLFALVGVLLWWTYRLIKSPSIEAQLSDTHSPRAKERTKKCRCCRILALIAFSAATGATWWLSTPTLDSSVGSPHGVYRLDEYVPSPLQQMLHLRYKIPRFVRLYRVNPDMKLLGESEVVDMDYGQGEVFWSIEEFGKVSVGMEISFKNIPKECDPICPEWPPPPPPAPAETQGVKP